MAGEAQNSTITAIKPLRSDADRCSIRVGKKSVATIPWEQVRTLGLRVGDVWDDALADRVAPIAAADGARRDALRLINRRDYSTGELRFKLRQKGHEDANIDPVIERLLDKGLIDDEAYGRSVIASQRARKPAGARLLRHKLMQKRLPRDLIDRLIAEAEDDHDAVGEARRLAEQRLSTAALQRCDANKRRQRVWSLLARRGFSPDTIRDALSTLGDQLNEDEPMF